MEQNCSLWRLGKETPRRGNTHEVGRNKPERGFFFCIYLPTTFSGSGNVTVATRVTPGPLPCPRSPSGPAAHPRSRLTECRLSWKAATKPFSRPSKVSLLRIPSFRQSKTRVTLERSAWMAAMAWENASRFTPGLSAPSAILAGRARPPGSLRRGGAGHAGKRSPGRWFRVCFLASSCEAHCF